MKEKKYKVSWRIEVIEIGESKKQIRDFWEDGCLDKKNKKESNLKIEEIK